MRDAHPALQKLNFTYEKGDKNYLMSNYDVFCYYLVFTEQNPLTMIRNSLVEGLNACFKMPSAIVILCGDLIMTHDDLFLPSEIERKIRWILRDIMAAIAARKSMLSPKAFTFGEPRIIWIKAFQTRTNNHIPQENLLRYNNILRRVCHNKAVYTPDLDFFIASTARCYDARKRINEQSFDELWLSVSDTIKSIDERDEKYAVDKKVEDRLKELKLQGELKFERQAHTFLSMTGKTNFSDTSGQGSIRNSHSDEQDRSARSRSRSRDYRHSRRDRYRGDHSDHSCRSRSRHRHDHRKNPR